MPSALGSVITNTLVMNMVDYTDEPAKVSIPLGGAISNADIQTIVDDYVALTNCLVVPRLIRTYGFTGVAVAGKPSASAQNLSAAILAMEFQKVNPVNAAKDIVRQLAIPAYLDALRNDGVKPHVPVTGNATLNALITLLSANLTIQGSDGLYYPGGWTYNVGSKFGTKLTVTDGF